MAADYFVKIPRDAAANILLYCHFYRLRGVRVSRPRHAGRRHRGSHIGGTKSSRRLPKLGLQDLHKMPAKTQEATLAPRGVRLDQTTVYTVSLFSIGRDRSDQISDG